MSFFAVLFALLLEQVKPLPRAHVVRDAVTGWLAWTARNFDAGKASHAWVVWTVGVAVPALAAWGLYELFAHVSLLLALAFDVGLLYLTLGFRQFSHYFTDIRAALERGDELEARRLLAAWRGLDTSELPPHELLRHVIEHSLLAAHRHVFGVFFWFVVLSTFGFGAAGAVLYRLAESASRCWNRPGDASGLSANPGLGVLAARIFQVLDHVPARLTAFGFAVVGNFEEAVATWRRDAPLWRRANEGVILAAAAGAVGVQLGGESPSVASADARDRVDAAGSTPGLPPQMGHLRSVVGLVWRSMVLWMLLLALLSLANLVG